MNLLIILPRQPHTTGNHVSARRFATSLIRRGWQVRILEVDIEEPAPIRAALQSPPDLVLLIHAYRSGRPWLLSQAPKNLPVAVFLSGSDLHQDLHDPDKAGVINQILTEAACVLIQNELTFDELQTSALPWRTKLHLLPPGIELGSEPYPLRRRLGLGSADLLMLHPASIRPIKGNLQLLLMTSGLLNHSPKLHLAFCGPLLDAAYSAEFLTALKAQRGAVYLGEIPAAAMPDTLQQADLILNNSVSEGLPNALVEAASLGRPILARNIPGNRALVKAGSNGLLYADAEDFDRQLRRLIFDPQLRRSLSRPDPQAFSADTEGERLAGILTGSARAATRPGQSGA
jgi:glycosyltransferase involved in cell wall biosynthesis